MVIPALPLLYAWFMRNRVASSGHLRRLAADARAIAGEISCGEFSAGRPHASRSQNLRDIVARAVRFGVVDLSRRWAMVIGALEEGFAGAEEDLARTTARLGKMTMLAFVGIVAGLGTSMIPTMVAGGTTVVSLDLSWQIAACGAISCFAVCRTVLLASPRSWVLDRGRTVSVAFEKWADANLMGNSLPLPLDRCRGSGPMSTTAPWETQVFAALEYQRRHGGSAREEIARTLCSKAGAEGRMSRVRAARWETFAPVLDLVAGGILAGLPPVIVWTG